MPYSNSCLRWGPPPIVAQSCSPAATHQRERRLQAVLEQQKDGGDDAPKARRTPGQYPDPLGNRGGRAGKPWRVLNRGAEYNARAAKACADGVEDAGCWRGRGGQIASHPQQVHTPEARGWTAETREGRRRRRRRGDEGERRDRIGRRDCRPQGGAQRTVAGGGRHADKQKTKGQQDGGGR